MAGGRYEVLHVYRRPADCVYTLAFDLSDPAVIRFVEYYEYLPQPDDPGREYAYSVVVGIGELDALTACLSAVAEKVAGGPPAEPEGIPLDDTPRDPRAAALVAAGRALVAAGALVDIGAAPADPVGNGNAARLAGWLDAAGVPYERTAWSWFNSE
jgi:hypothetical protein